MANEFVHGTVGVSMTQAEFEAVGLHVCNSQATGDVIYASSATQLTRLGIGATNAILTVIGGVPTWQTSLSGLTFVAPALGAATATSVNGLTITTTAGTLTIANSASAALVTSGAYSITLTATAATNVTLPTTGTLATLAGTEEFTNKTLNASVLKGTFLASGTVTFPAITLGGTISGGAQTLRNIGRADIGVDSVDGLVRNRIRSTFTSDGAGEYAVGLQVDGTLTGAGGDTDRLNGMVVTPVIVTQTATENIATVASLFLGEPQITKNITGNITVAATLYINSAPTEGVTNAAIAVAAGDIKILGSTDSAAIADQVALGGYEIGVGNRVLAISQETAVAADTDETKFSNKLQVRINGATYYVMLTTT